MLFGLVKPIISDKKIIQATLQAILKLAFPFFHFTNTFLYLLNKKAHGETMNLEEISDFRTMYI